MTTLVLYRALRNGDEGCICHPMMFAPVIVGGALVGGLGGFVVHGWVTEQPERRIAVGFSLGH